MDNGMTQRDLSEGENAILNLIQVHYGPLNTREEVAIYDRNEAVIWVKDAEGLTVLMVNLTSLAEWLAGGPSPVKRNYCGSGLMYITSESAE